MNINELSAIANVCNYLCTAINNTGLSSKDDVKILVNKRNLLTKKFIELVKEVDIDELFNQGKTVKSPFEKAKAEPVFVIAGQGNDEDLNVKDPINVDENQINKPQEGIIKNDISEPLVSEKQEKKIATQDDELLKRIAEEKAALKTKKKPKKD